MDDLTFISLFSGGGGADIGAKLAGYKPICANEYDPGIAAIYAANVGGHIRVGDILDQNPKDYPRCDLLHASPPCPNFSSAKAHAEETSLDIACAEKTAEFIRALGPEAFTLENVPAYRHSKSYKIILRAVAEGGYMYDARILNSANYGVPQTRRRFFLRAQRGLIRAMPEPKPWIGWYAAIEDLIPTLPESEFAPWQLARLPQNISNVLINPSRTSRKWIQETDVIPGDKPSPSVTVGIGTMPRAFLVDGQNTRVNGDLTIRKDYEPSYTISSTATKGMGRAWLSQGRVVSMTLRALARFQSFPDSYEPLTARIVGNAVPPLMYAAVARSLLP